MKTENSKEPRIKKSNGRWSKTQQNRFITGLQRYGKDWASIQKIVKSRTLTQVRSHAQKFFIAIEEEDKQYLIGKEFQFKNCKSSETTEKKIQYKESVNHTSKTQIYDRNNIKVQKKERNLLDIFMKVIQQQSRQSQMQFLDKQFEEKSHIEKLRLKEILPLNNIGIGICQLEDIPQCSQEKSTLFVSPNEIPTNAFQPYFNLDNKEGNS